MSQSQRPMTAPERATLDYMLSVDDPRVIPLRLQADHAEVVSTCECGCATINLAVDQDAAAIAPGLPYAAIDAEQRLPFAGDDFYEMIVFVRDGWLSSLEVVW